MNNPNAPVKRLKIFFKSRWAAEDYPGAEPRFQITLLAKDIAVFILLPVLAIILFKSCEATGSTQRRSNKSIVGRDKETRYDVVKSQIINFQMPGSGGLLSGFNKSSPGTLVRLRLQNQVETYSNAPVHAQIVGGELGKNLLGGILIGDAVSDTGFERINITFRYVRDPRRTGIALPIAARALSLDGTLGIVAKKKEEFLTRSVLGSAGTVGQEATGKGGNLDLQQIVIKALTAGLLQEFSSGTQIEGNRAHVLTLEPSTEFFAELTDFFPGAK